MVGLVTDVVVWFRWPPSVVWALPLWELGHWASQARAGAKAVAAARAQQARQRGTQARKRR